MTTEPSADSRAWFAREFAHLGYCLCDTNECGVPGSGCKVCRSLPKGWPCPAQGGYPYGTHIGDD